jgi:hypothetical protein
MRPSDVLCDDLGKLDLKFRRKDGPSYAKDRAKRFSFIDTSLSIPIEYNTEYNSCCTLTFAQNLSRVATLLNLRLRNQQSLFRLLTVGYWAYSEQL